MLIKKWIEALRSGKYKQCCDRLREDNSFCCLGVLCDVYDSKQWKTNEDGEYSYMNNNFELPSEITKEIGLSQEDQDRLIHMNDVPQSSFEQIADYLEKTIYNDA